MIEIERKFLVQNTDFKAQAHAQYQIAQGYLNSHPERAVRVRIKNDKAYITVKGKSNSEGISRFEWEKEISLHEAKALLLLCEKGIIEKIRYEVKAGNHNYEVDEFFGENEGLLLAEIELEHEKEYFEKPDWLGQEVTGDEKYYNAYLNNNPYKSWSR